MKKTCMLLLAAMLALTGCRAQQTDIPQLMEPVGIDFDTAFVQLGQVCELEAFDFAVAPTTEALFFTLDGTVAEICVLPGENASKGQDLMRLDVESELKQIEQINAQMSYLAKDNALALELLAMDIDLCKYQMENRDYKEGGKLDELKENELKQLETALEQEQQRQQLELKQLSAQKAELQLTIEASVLTAPFDGQVVYLPQIHNGSTVRSGQTVVMLADESIPLLQGEFISASIIDNASELWGLVGDQTLALEYEPMDTEEYVSKLLSGEEMTTSFSLSGEIPADICMGDYAQVIIKSRSKSNVLYLPPNCLYRDASGNYVYVKDGDARRRVDVVVGNQTTVAIEIKEGLAKGDEVYVKE